MNRLKLDYDNIITMTVFSDTLFTMFFDEEYLDDDCKTEIQDLQVKYPLGLELVEYELIPNDNKAIIKVVPYINDPFQAEYYLSLTKYILCEIKIEDEYLLYRFISNFKDLSTYGEPKKVKIKINEYGLKYFSFNDDDKSMIYLREFKKY